MQNERNGTMRGTGKYSIMYMAALLCLPAIAAEVDVGDGTNDNTYSDSASYAAATKIVKTGTGKTTLNFGTYATNPGFTGAIEVQEGTLAVHGIANLGTPTKITVSDGATLDLTTQETSDPTNLRGKEIVITGSGYDGAGALVRGGTKGVNNLFRTLTLAGDATITINVQTGLGDTSSNYGIVKLNGHTLTKSGSNKLYCPNVRFFGTDGTTADPGNIVVAEGTLFLHNGNTLQGGSANNTITLQNGAKLQLRNTNPIKWSVKAFGSAQILSDNTASVSTDVRNHLCGPISAASQLAINADVSTPISLSTNSLTVGEKLTVGGNGILSFHDVAVTNTGMGRVEVANNGGIARLKLDGRSSMTAFTTDSGRAQTRLYIAESSARRGIMEIGAGVVVTNYGLSIGKDGFGAMYQRGGSTYWPIASPSWDQSGHNTGAYGYLGITGGRFALDAEAEPNNEKSVHFAAKGVFAMALHGGSAEFNASTNIGFAVYDGTLAYYQDGGTTNTFDFEFGFGRNKDRAQAGHAAVTVAGEGTALVVKEYLRMFWTDPAAEMFVNLNDGGTLSSRYLYRIAANAPLWLNLNGGVIKPRLVNAVFSYNNDLNRCPERSTVYEQGFTIDMSDVRNRSGEIVDGTVTVPISFLAPGDGKRVASIALPSDAGFASEKIVGPPLVTISGDGQGASAFALFDDTTCTVTNIVVTSPGWGYTTATATLSSGGLAADYSCAVMLEDQPATGWKGFTKRGANRLEMYGCNTFKGDVTVEDGILGFMATNTASTTVAQGGMPEGAGVTLKEGSTLTFQSRNVPVTVPFLAGCGTTSYGLFTVTNRIECSAAEIFAGKHLTVNQSLTLADGVRIVVTDPENLTQYRRSGSVDVVTAGRGVTCQGSVSLAFGANGGMESPEMWSLTVKSNAIKLKYIRGMVVVFH